MCSFIELCLLCPVLIINYRLPSLAYLCFTLFLATLISLTVVLSLLFFSTFSHRSFLLTSISTLSLTSHNFSFKHFFTLSITVSHSLTHSLTLSISVSTSFFLSLSLPLSPSHSIFSLFYSLIPLFSHLEPVYPLIDRDHGHELYHLLNQYSSLSAVVVNVKIKFFRWNCNDK